MSEKVEVIIKIPKYYLTHPQDYSCLAECVRRGVPLPKGHGRLKDIDAFISKVQADRQHAVYTRSWTADDVLNALTDSYAPTVIEADKEGEET